MVSLLSLVALLGSASIVAGSTSTASASLASGSQSSVSIISTASSSLSTPPSASSIDSSTPPCDNKACPNDANSVCTASSGTSAGFEFLCPAMQTTTRLARRATQGATQAQCFAACATVSICQSLVYQPATGFCALFDSSVIPPSGTTNMIGGLKISGSAISTTSSAAASAKASTPASSSATNQLAPVKVSIDGGQVSVIFVLKNAQTVSSLSSSSAVSIISGPYIAINVFEGTSVDVGVMVQVLSTVPGVGTSIVAPQLRPAAVITSSSSTSLVPSTSALIATATATQKSYANELVANGGLLVLSGLIGLVAF